MPREPLTPQQVVLRLLASVIALAAGVAAVVIVIGLAQGALG